MMTNRTIKIVLCQVLALAILGIGMAPNGFAKDPGATQDMELLFIQNATSGTFNGKTLVLKEVGPTIFFTDRPYRVEGHLRTELLFQEWNKGADSFAADPPNGALSILDENAVKSIVLELFDPKLDGNTISYRVKILEGKIPRSFKMASLFIDPFRRRPGAFIGAALVGGMIGHHIATASQPKTTVVVQDPGNYYVHHYPPPSDTSTVEERIQKLDDLADKGYITPEEYKARKKAILDSI